MNLEIRDHSLGAGEEGTERETLAVATGEEIVLAAEGLVKRYPGSPRPAVAGLTFAVRAGEAFGLLGPNGAGKTTAISLLCTLLRPDAGTFTVDGIDGGRRAKTVRQRIGLVPQEIALYPRLTARENLRYFARLYGLKGLLLEERVVEALDLVQLAEHADRPVAAFSGGMKRRANLAAGVLHRPKVLFLDEPTVGIDAQSRNLILGNLAQLKETGTTLVYTTHYMEEAQQLCDRVAIIDGGRLIACGPPAELVARRSGCRNLEDLFLQLTGRRLRDN